MDCSLPGSSVNGISQQEYRGMLPFPSSGDLPDPGIQLASPASSYMGRQILDYSATWEALHNIDLSGPKC